MNNELKYVVRGAFVAILIVASTKIVQSYILKNISTSKDPVVVDNSKKNIVHTIANIEGQHLFNEHCTACHQITKRDGFLIRGAEERVGRTLLCAWIRNSSKVLQSGDLYYNNLAKEYGGVKMPDFLQLTNEQIDAMLDYLKEVEAQE